MLRASPLRRKSQESGASLRIPFSWRTLRDAASPPFFASLYVVRNAGSRSAALTESMFSADPGTVAVGIDRDELLPGESSQVFIVTKKEPSR